MALQISLTLTLNDLLRFYVLEILLSFQMKEKRLSQRKIIYYITNI